MWIGLISYNCLYRSHIYCNLLLIPHLFYCYKTVMFFAVENVGIASLWHFSHTYTEETAKQNIVFFRHLNCFTVSDLILSYILHYTLTLWFISIFLYIYIVMMMVCWLTAFSFLSCSVSFRAPRSVVYRQQGLLLLGWSVSIYSIELLF